MILRGTIPKKMRAWVKDNIQEVLDGKHKDFVVKKENNLIEVSYQKRGER